MSYTIDNLCVTDFGKICRTCLGEGQMKCLNEKCCKDDCLIEMLLSVTFLQLSDKDGLPFQICFNCEEELTRAYNFATKCLEVDKKLKNCFKEFESRLPNKTNKESSNKTLKIIENQEIEFETVEMQIKTEIEIDENADYLLSNIKPEQLSENEQDNEKQDIFDKQLTQNKDENYDESIDNERIPENSGNETKVKNENKHNSESHDVIDNKWSQIEDKSIFQDDSDENEEYKFVENLHQNKISVSGEKITDKKSVPKEGKETKTIGRKIIKKKVEQIFQCKKCYETFPTSKLLWVHYKAVQHPSRIICKICSEPVRWQTMTAHMRIHTKEKPFGCKICSKQFSLSGNLTRHMKIHTGEKSFKCQFCDRSFNQSSTLKIHLRIHTGEKPYICENCGKGFRSSGVLKFHLRSHEDKSKRENNETSDESEIPHECNICHRKFKSVSFFKAHMGNHAAKNILCSVCGLRFANKTTLEIHSSVHTGLKRFSCDTCGKKFNQKIGLRTHKLIHTGEKPHICKICNRGFTQPQHLKYHQRTHTDEKPYSCNFCDKRFAQNVNLRVHTRIHTGETPYLCPVCGKGFHDSSSMRKHKKRHELPNT